MFDFYEKRKIRGVLYSKPVIFVLLILTCMLSVATYNRFTVAQEMENKLGAKRVELDELKMRAQTLEEKVGYLENDRGIEEELRNRFDVAKEGEKVVILLDPTKDGKKNQSTSTHNGNSVQNIETPKKSFFEMLKFWK